MYSPCRPNVTPYRFVLYVQNVTLKQSLLLHSAYYVYRIGRPNVIIVCLLCRPNVTPYIFVLYVALQRPRSPWSACMNVTMVDYGIKRSRSNRTIFTLQAPMVWLIALYAVLAILRWMNVCNSTIRLFNSQLSTDLANDNIFLKQNVSSENFCCRCNYDIYVKCFCFKRCLQLFLFTEYEYKYFNIRRYYATTGHTYQNDIIKTPDPSSITKTQGASFC